MKKKEEIEEVEYKPITKTLRSMKVGDEVKFPFENRSSVFSMAGRIKLESKRMILFKLKTDENYDFVNVRRIQ